MPNQPSPEEIYPLRMGPKLIVQSALWVSLLFAFLAYVVIPVQATSPPEDPPTPTRVVEPPAAAKKENPKKKCKVSSAYPEQVLQWCNLITKQAKQAQLPPDLIAAVILQESGGNPTAYSHSGAVGLMQVMPRDGIAAKFNCINGPCFANRPTIKELEKPQFNVTFGTNMLAGLIQKHGSVRAGLKAYGPMDRGFAYADKVLAIWDRYGKP